MFRLLKVLYSNYHKLHMKNPVKNIDHLIDGAVYRCSGEVGKIDDFQSTRGVVDGSRNPPPKSVIKLINLTFDLVGLLEGLERIF